MMSSSDLSQTGQSTGGISVVVVEMSDDEYPIVVDVEMSAKPRIGVAVDITDSKVELKFILATTYRKKKKKYYFYKKKKFL